MKVENHTFVVCAYKESPYLEECLNSLFNQTLQSKIIVASSTPNNYVRNMCKDKNIPFFEIKGGGIGADWNSALSLADTQYATIAHQDDIYLPNYLETILSNSKDFLISFTDYNEIDENNAIISNKNLAIKKLLLSPIKWFPSSKFIRRLSLSFGCGICCPSVTYDLTQLKNFKFDTNLKVDLDWDAWERISKLNGRFAYHKSSLMQHRIHKESETTKRIDDDYRTKEDRIMFSKFWPKSITMLLMKFYSSSQDSNR